MHVHVHACTCTCMYIHVAASEKWILFYVHFGLTNQISVPMCMQSEGKFETATCNIQSTNILKTCNWSLFFYYNIFFFFFLIFFMKVIFDNWSGYIINHKKQAPPTNYCIFLVLFGREFYFLITNPPALLNC